MIKIANFEIGRLRAPFVIAEMSGNHNQSLERALEIVDASAKWAMSQLASKFPLSAEAIRKKLTRGKVA